MCGLPHDASLNPLQMIHFVKQNDTKHLNPQNKKIYLKKKKKDLNGNEIKYCKPLGVKFDSGTSWAFHLFPLMFIKL